jgi:hypothetical protein
MAVKLTTARELAERLNVRQETVGDVIRCMGITPRRHPNNGRGYGLTPAECKAIRDRLRPVRQAAPAVVHADNGNPCAPAGA